MIAPHSSAPVFRGFGGIDSDRCCQQLESHSDMHLGQHSFLGHQPSAGSSTYVNLWEVSARARLPPGEYLVVPSTFELFQDGDFCLRVFSEKKARALCMSYPTTVCGSLGARGGGQLWPCPCV